MLKDFFKENKTLIIVFLMIIIITPIILLTPSPIGVIPQNIGLELVGYFGSILGGFFTLYGVWWTITDQNSKKEVDLKLRDKERKENLAIQYKPMLIVKRILYDKTICIKKDSLSEYQIPEYQIIQHIHDPKYTPKLKSPCLLLNTLIANKGRGEALNIKIKPNKYLANDIFIAKSSETCFSKLLPSNENTLLTIYLGNYAKYKSNTCIEIPLDIYYTDLYNCYEYKTSVTIVLNLLEDAITRIGNNISKVYTSN